VGIVSSVSHWESTLKAQKRSAAAFPRLASPSRGRAAVDHDLEAATKIWHTLMTKGAKESVTRTLKILSPACSTSSALIACQRVPSPKPKPCGPSGSV